MTPEHYLLFSIKNRCYQYAGWMVSAFGVIRPSDKLPEDVYPGYLFREPYAMYFIDENGEKVKIDLKPDALNSPLFRKEDMVQVTPEWLPSISENLSTRIGTLIANAVVLFEPFGAKFPYLNTKFTARTVEAILAPKLRGTPKLNEERGGEFFYADELHKYYEAVTFLESLSHLFVHSVTRIGLLPPPGRKEFREATLKKYEGKLNDPVYVAQFEAEMEAFDKEYLKNDPAYGKHMTGKVSGARLKSFMTQGAEGDPFRDSKEVVPIIKPLEDDIPLDPEGFVGINNAIRWGSYSRGVETINGGVLSKAIGVSVEGWRIAVTKGQNDCGTREGIYRTYDDSDVYQLAGRTIVEGTSLKYIETVEQAKTYVGKRLLVRSPAYCKLKDNTTCEVCAGERLSKFPNGVSIPLMELSGGVLKDSLKAMHNTKVVTAVLDFRTALS